jgi:hypothetical protein
MLRNLSLGYQQTNQFVAIRITDNGPSLRFDEKSVLAQRKSMPRFKSEVQQGSIDGMAE